MHFIYLALLFICLLLIEWTLLKGRDFCLFTAASPALRKHSRSSLNIGEQTNDRN